MAPPNAAPDPRDHRPPAAPGRHRRGVLRHAIARFVSHDCPQLAATISFYVLFSGIPAVALLVATFGMLLANDELRRGVTDHVLGMMPFGTRQNRKLVADALLALQGASGGLTVAGLTGLAWSAFGMLAAIRWALNRAWGVPNRRGLVRPRLLDLALALALWLVMFLSLAGTTVLHTLRAYAEGAIDPAVRLDWMWNAANWLLPAALTFVAFLLLYRYVPNVPHGMADVWPAAVVATLLFELAKHGFAWYVTSLSRHEALYGTLGSLMLFMLWTYVSAMLFLFGAEIAAAREWRRHHHPA